MAQSPPRVDLYPSHHAATFTTFTADIDLTSQSGYPAHCAERVVLVNGTGGALVASLTDYAGHTYNVTVPAGVTWAEDHAVAIIEAATADTFTEIRAYWWASGSHHLNP